MALKISELDAITTAASTDIVHVRNNSGLDKKITYANFQKPLTDRLDAIEEVTFDTYITRVFRDLSVTMVGRRSATFGSGSMYHANGVINVNNASAQRTLENVCFKGGHFYALGQSHAWLLPGYSSPPNMNTSIPTHSLGVSDTGQYMVHLRDNGSSGTYVRSQDYGDNFTSGLATNPTFIGGTSRKEVVWAFDYFYNVSSGGTLYRAPQATASVWTAVTTNATGMTSACIFRAGSQVWVCHVDSGNLKFRKLVSADAMGTDQTVTTGGVSSAPLNWWCGYAPAGGLTPEGYYLYLNTGAQGELMYSADLITWTESQNQAPAVGDENIRGWIICPITGHCYMANNYSLFVTPQVSGMWTGVGMRVMQFPNANRGITVMTGEYDHTYPCPNPGFIGINSSYGSDAETHMATINYTWQDLEAGKIVIT